MRTSFKRILSLILVVAMLSGLLSGLTVVNAAEAAATDYVPGIGDASNIKRDGPADVDWSAKWIWSTDSTSMHNWLCMRKTVELETVPATAEARISIDSRYWLWINGEMVVYEGGVKRGPNVEDSYFDTVDIAPYLQKGTNTIAVLGWYFGNDSDYYSYNSSGKAGFVFEADLGGVKVISDNTWKVHKEDGYLKSTSSSDPGSQPNYRLPEENIFYDGRLGAALGNWQAPGYDDSAWANATELGKVGDAPWHDLWTRSIPLLKWSDILAYTNDDAYAAYKTAATTAAVNIGMNLPYNMQMQPYLKVEAPAGLKIQMTSDGDETVRTSYITTDGVQEFEGLGWMSCQTVTYKFPAGVKILELGYRQTGYNTEFAGSFSSEDEFFNRLWMESLWTLYITMRDNYMDCPDRERAQWWGDATNESHETFYALSPDSYLLYRKGVDTVIGWRGQTGSMDDRVLCTVVPINTGHFELPMQQLAGVVGFWTYYQYTGERDFLEQVYEPSVTYLTCWTMKDNGLVNHRGGSWDWLDWGSHHDQVVLENAWYYWACQRVLMMAEELGIEADKSFLISRMESIKAAYPSLWDAERGAFYNQAGDSKADDRGNAIAVLSGLATPDQYDAITNTLVNIHKSSPYMEKYVLDALYAMDKQTEALDRMKARYTAMVNDKWTTLWENFGNPGSGTHNHAWSGGPLINLSANVAGVAPDAPGYETYHVIPQLGYLNNIDCTVPSIKGDIVVSIDRDLTAKTYAMTLTSPENTVARVAVPRFEGENTVVSFGNTVVFADGKAANTVEGVAYESNDDQYIYFNVQPGTYSLNASVKAPEAAETYTLTINATEGGYVTVDGVKVETPYTATVAAGTQVALNAVADSKMELLCWSGTYGFSTVNPTLTMKDNVTLTAVFGEKNYSAYKIISIKETCDTDILVDVDGVKYEVPCSIAVKEGEDVTITAVDGIGWDFVNWEGPLFAAGETLNLLGVTDSVELVLQGAYKGNASGNQSLGAKVTVDDEYVGGSQWRASNLTDGTKLNDGGCTTMQWYAAEGGPTDRPTLKDGVLPEPATLTIDLGKVKAFDTFRIYPRGAYDNEGNAVNFIVDYKIMVSNDGSDWKTIYEKVGQENPGRNFVEIGFEPQNAQYIRLSVTKLGSPYMEGWSVPVHRLQLSELEVYNYNAKPTTGTVTIEGVGEGTVLVNGKEQTLPYTATYNLGDVVAIEPQNATNYKFVGWTGDMESTDAPIYLNVESDIDLTANFVSTQVKPLGISENLARGKKVTSSVSDIGGSWAVGNLTDGVVIMPNGTSGGFSTGNVGSTDLSKNPVDITLDFGANVDFNSVKFYPRNGVYTTEGTNCHFPTSFKVYVMLDEETVWREMATFTKVTSDPGEPIEVKFPLQNARYMKISVTEITQPAADEMGGPWYRIQMAEIEAYLSPLTPENLAKGGKITSNDSLMESETWSCANLLDGKLRSSGRNLSTGIKGFTSSNYGGPDLANPIWVNAALPGAQTVNQVILYPRSDIDAIAADTGITPNFPTKYDIQVKNAAGQYETVASVDHGDHKYNINSAPQVIDFGKDVTTTDVRLVVYRLGQPTWDEKTGDAGAFRLQLCEFQVGYVPNANAALEDIKEGAITIEGDTATLTDPAEFTAVVTDSDLATNDVIWSVENADGTVSDVAVLYGTTDLTTFAVPFIPGTAYLVARMNNGLKTVAKYQITVEDIPEVDPDVEAAAAVDTLIDEIGEVTLESEAAIVAARAAYTALTDAQKALVTKLAALEAAEKTYAALVAAAEQEAADKAAATAVDTLINEIGEVTLESEAAIAAARAAYEALTDAQKGYVTALATLEAAEKTYEELVAANAKVQLRVSGTEEVTVATDELTYTIAMKDAVQVATAELTIELSTDVLGTPVIEGKNGWFVILQSWKDGVLTVLMGNNAGLTSEEYVDILSITAPIVGETGTANLVVTEAVVSAYAGEGERFVEADLTEASFSTKVEFNIYDVNRDGVVDQLDITRAQRCYGDEEGAENWNPRADVNGDKTVDINDLILILNNYTK